MDSSIAAARTSNVRILAASRPSQIAVVSALLLLFAVAWFAASRAALTSRSASSDGTTRVAAVASRDEATQRWVIPAPAPEVRVAPRPTPVVDPTDWSALSLGVSGVAPAATVATADARPAELANSMSERERRMVLATVRSSEPEGLPSPQGYTPGIVVLVPGGASSDGICR